MDIKTILLPVDFPNTSLPVIHQAATLARRFHSEIVALHVMTQESHRAGVPEDGAELAGWDLVAEIVKRAEEKKEDRALGPQLAGLAIRRLLVRDEPAQAIVDVALQQRADLIMMASHGYTFDHFLLSSLTEKTLQGPECPVWTSAHVKKPPLASAPEFAIRKVLCAVEFGARSHKTLSWAAQMAAEFEAQLTLAHVTYNVGIWAPGGDYVNPKLKAELVGDASRQMAELQQEVGTKAEVFIGSGNLPDVLRRAVQQTKADLLVNDCFPYGVNLRTRGYAVICAVGIPVMNV